MGWKSQSKAEIVHSDLKRVEYLPIDGVFVQINKIHLFSDLLHSSFGAKGGNIGTNVTMSICSNLCKNSLNNTIKIYLLVQDQHRRRASCSLCEFGGFQGVLLGPEYRCRLSINSLLNGGLKEMVNVTSFVFVRWHIFNWLDINIHKKPFVVNVLWIS